MLVMSVLVMVLILSVIASSSAKEAILLQHSAQWQSAHVAVSEATRMAAYCVFKRLLIGGMVEWEGLQTTAVQFDVTQLPHMLPSGVSGCDVSSELNVWQSHQLNHVKALTATEYCGSGQVLAASGSDAQWFASHQYMTTAVAEVEYPGRMRVLDQQFWQHMVPRDTQVLSNPSDYRGRSTEQATASVGELCIEYVAPYPS